MSRVANLSPNEISKAFRRAQSGLPTLVGLSGHDFRDLGREVELVRTWIAEISPQFPEVRFKYCEAVEAFRRVTAPERAPGESLKLAVALEREPNGDVPRLTISTVHGKVFGPQPFLAIETRSGRFIHDNFDFSPNGDAWQYAFHSDTLPLSDVRRIGIAANDAFADTFIEVIDVD